MSTHGDAGATTVAVETPVRVPMVPNFLIPLQGGAPISVAALSPDDVNRVIHDWSAALRANVARLRRLRS